MSISNWDDISILSPETVEHEVAGTPQNFYPISVARLGKVRKQFSLLAKSIGTLLKDADEEQGTHTISAANGSTEFIRMPKTEALAMHHDRMRSQSIDQIFEGVMEANNLNALACVCMESMREVFPDAEDKDAAAFVKNVPLPVFGQMLVGVVKANKGIFGPFGNKAVQMAETRLNDLTTPPEMTEADTDPATTPESSSPNGEPPKAESGPRPLPNPATSGTN